MKASDDQIKQAYRTTGSIWRAAKLLGMCGQSVHERLKKLEVDTTQDGVWKDWQLESLRREYAKPKINLDDLARRIGKLKSNVSRKARSFGLTRKGRRAGEDKWKVPKEVALRWLDEYRERQPIRFREFGIEKGLDPNGITKAFKYHGLHETAMRIHACRYSALEVVVARFEKRIKKIDGCWEWSGSRFRDGYGRFKGLGENKAHRVSYKIYKGHVPADILVCHHCDNPPCVNPSHLFIGTHKDNLQDSINKGRRRRRNEPTMGS